MSYVPHSPLRLSPIALLVSATRYISKRIVATLVALFHQLQAERKGRNSAAKLMEFDDAMLRDIGLTRSDVMVSMRSKDADPTRTLGTLANERRSTWYVR